MNGTSLGVAWHAPYRIEATKGLKAGRNQLTIKGINPLVYRLIGDQQPNANKITFADVTPYSASSPLMPSGLIGHVQIIRKSTQ